MPNLAGVIPAARAPLEIKEVETYKPGPHELLVRNEVISFNPVEAKIARLALISVPYPTILGLSYAGTVEAVGSQVSTFGVGDKVAVRKQFTQVGPKYGAYQRYVLAGDHTASKVPDGVGLTEAASLIGNLTTVAGLFGVRAGLDRPQLDDSATPKKGPVLVYGGTSSVGSLAVQWVRQAGYDVVTTSSPKHKSWVSTLGAKHIVDHTQQPDALVKDLISFGPYSLVVDCIGLPPTVAVNAQVVAAQGGGKVYATLPPFGPETLPKGVVREFASWPDIFEEDKTGLEKWTYETYLPQALAKGRLIAQPVEKIGGGLSKGVNNALDKLNTGVSGIKLVVDPWE